MSNDLTVTETDIQNELIDNAVSKLTGGVKDLLVGYDRKKAEHAQFRPMTEHEILTLSSGEHVWFEASDGTARRIKINGKVRTWKRDPNRVEIPVKYGLYETGCLDLIGAKKRLLIRID